MTEYDGPDPDDVSTNPTDGPIFSEVVRSRAARRTVLAGGLAGAATFMTAAGLGGLPAAAARPGGGPKAAADLLGFDPVPLGFGDDVVVPDGYTARTFIPWGTPITGSYPEFAPGANTAEEQAQQAGMNHDGMHFFPLSRRSSSHGVMVVNHEYTNEQYLQSPEATPAERAAKSQAAHGLSVIEVKEDAPGEWSVVRSRLNRRITANTPMSVSGPAAGHRLLQTAADPAGRTVLGTWNNCSSGATPWGTYLAAEENFHSYFAVAEGDFGDQTAQMERYGVGGDRFGWAVDDRFLVTPEDPNEPNRFGWIVELDPMDPQSRPIKRTALGRVKHEGATVHTTKGGRVAVYCGDDQRGEHVYKFVSDDNWKAARARGRSPLDHGTLYVARFNDDGSGDWLPLVHGQGGLTAENGFADQAEVLVKTRLAASVVGATKMDRPEWITVDPHTQMVYCTLTNNTDPSTREPNAANPRDHNPWGHVIRWQESGNDHTATTFSWDHFLLAGQGDDSGDGSTIAAEDGFGSPDGIASDADGRVWIQTDGSQPEGATNQMLAANPYATDAEGRPEIRRFLTGPSGCEVTGLTLTPDQRTMFINIQHPGGVWPHEDGVDVPRSATVVITKDDGGVIGSSDAGRGNGRGRGRR